MVLASVLVEEEALVTGIAKAMGVVRVMAKAGSGSE